MSYASKITFAGACVFSVGIITYVHYRQQYDREQLHKGVVRDLQRQQQRKIENLYLLQQQIDLTKKLKQDASQTDVSKENVT